MSFETQQAAKKYFIEKVLHQARKENVSLSESEVYMLGWTETEAGFTINEGLNAKFDSETTEEEYEKKIANLIRNAYKADIDQYAGNNDMYKEALKVLKKGDHYILVMINAALNKSINVGSKDKRYDFYSPVVGFTFIDDFSVFIFGAKGVWDKIIMVAVGLLLLAIFYAVIILKTP